MFSSMIIEPDVDERVFRDVKLPPVKRPDKRRPRLVRWLQWFVAVVVVAGVATVGYFLVRDDSSSVVNPDPFGIQYRQERAALIPDALLPDAMPADPFGTRYREAGAVIPEAIAPASAPAPGALAEWFQSLMLPAGTDLADVAHLTGLTDIYLSRVSPSASVAVISDVPAITPQSWYVVYKTLNAVGMLPAGPNDLAEAAHLSALTDIYLSRVSRPDYGEVIRPVPGHFGGPL